MLIRLNVSISGTRNGEEWPVRGSVIDLPNAEAVGLLNAGMASPVADSIESADATAPAETAVKPKAKRR